MEWELQLEVEVELDFRIRLDFRVRILLEEEGQKGGKKDKIGGR